MPTVSPSYALPQAGTNVTPFHGCSLGGSGVIRTSGPAAVAWPGSNIAVYVPFRLVTPITFSNMFIQNGVPSGNVCLGVYDQNGARLVTTGSTAGSGSSANQIIAVTTTTLTAGLYYLAAAMDNGTATVSATTFTTATLISLHGIANQATAFVLPTTATFATPANYVPLFGITSRGF